MLPMLRPAQAAGLPTLSYPVKNSGKIGDIKYGAVAPNASYLPANGKSITAASYPEYAKQFSKTPGYYSRRLTDASTMPSGNVILSGIAISSDGIYAAAPNGNGSTDLFVYKISETSVTYLSTLSASVPGSSYSLSFAPNGDYLVTGSSNAPYLAVYRRSVGTDTFGPSQLTITGTALSSTVLCVDVTDDNIVFASSNTSPFGILFQISGSSVTRLASGLPTLPSTPFRISRNKAGTRYVFLFSSAPYVKVYDYSASVFTEIAGAIPAILTAPTAVAISESGEYIAISTATGTVLGAIVEIWKSTSLSSYGFLKGIYPKISLSLNIAFAPEDRHMVVSSSSAIAYYRIDNGNFSEISRSLPSGMANFPFRTIFPTKDSRFMLADGPSSFSIYAEAPTLADIPLPAYPSLGYGTSALNAYIKVK